MQLTTGANAAQAEQVYSSINVSDKVWFPFHPTEYESL